MAASASVLAVVREESQRLSAADFPEADFWTIFLREGGLADRLLLRITYGMAIYQHLRPVPPAGVS